MNDLKERKVLEATQTMAETIENFIKQAEQTQKTGRPKIIAIDGRCAAGKTTLGEFLKQRLSADLFHMDDFFLRPEQRTAERFASPGGNVDYERFRTEVLEKLWNGQAVKALRYDCRKQALEETASICSSGAEYVVIEGVYSMHPYLLPSRYLLRIFLSVPQPEQQQRILQRNGPELAQRFLKEWIPMEEMYFKAYEIPSNCELTFGL